MKPFYTLYFVKYSTISYSMFTRESQSARDLYFQLYRNWRASHDVHCKSRNISETVQDSDVLKYTPPVESDMAYRTALFPMIMSNFQGHAPIAGL